jgi:MYXO-CTERM domain-containing protein
MRKDLTSRVSVGVLVVMALAAFVVPLSAVTQNPAPVPEINAASVSAGLALLGAGMLWLRARRSVK